MRKTLLSIGAAFLASGLCLGLVGPLEAQSPTRQDKPNIVFVLTDDQRPETLKHMPQTRKYLRAPGRTFENATFTYPLCCPSRATIQTGQYPHNHDVTTNRAPEGGWPAFKKSQRQTAAVSLQKAGYDTAYFGKYMNDYNGDSVPAGYDRFYGKVQGEPYYYTETGSRDRLRSRDAQDVQVGDKARKYMDNRMGQDLPFFMTVGFYAPHGPGRYPDEHKGKFLDETSPRTPAYNEADVSDKPPYVRDKDRLTYQEKKGMDRFYQRQLRSLQVVDDWVGEVSRKLIAEKEMKNTYFVFYTDNSVHHGEHRLPYGKNTPYVTDTEFPLIVRGAGTQRGKDRRLVGNHDLAPTFSRMGNTKIPEKADGSTILPLIKGGTPGWRNAVLSERLHPNKGWSMIRRPNQTYVEYKSGEKEFYDLSEDPHQLENLVGSNDDPKRYRKRLSERLAQLEDCSQDECRRAEGRVN